MADDFAILRSVFGPESVEIPTSAASDDTASVDAPEMDEEQTDEVQTYVYPSSIELGVIDQASLPVLAMNDPIFSLFPVRETDSAMESVRFGHRWPDRPTSMR